MGSKLTNVEKEVSNDSEVHNPSDSSDSDSDIVYDSENEREENSSKASGVVRKRRPLIPRKVIEHTEPEKSCDETNDDSNEPKAVVGASKRKRASLPKKHVPVKKAVTKPPRKTSKTKPVDAMDDDAKFQETLDMEAIVAEFDDEDPFGADEDQPQATCFSDKVKPYFGPGVSDEQKMKILHHGLRRFGHVTFR